ncbi:MAG: hypothetical protein ACK4NE_10615 [Albidovulum sp.]
MRFPVLTLSAMGLIVASLAHAEITADQMAGKTLIGADKSKFFISPDGKLTGVTKKGDALVGTWQVKGGKWCRTIKEPQKLAGSACQKASIQGKTLTIIRDDGSSVTFTIK